MEREIGMKKIMMAMALTGLVACGAEGDPLRPTAGLGIGIGPGGISLRPKVGVTDGTSTVGVGSGGVSAGTRAGPVSVGGTL